MICPNCIALREQRAIQAEKARVIGRLKRGLPRPLRRVPRAVAIGQPPSLVVALLEGAVAGSWHYVDAR